MLCNKYMLNSKILKVQIHHKSKNKNISIGRLAGNSWGGGNTTDPACVPILYPGIASLSP